MKIVNCIEEVQVPSSYTIHKIDLEIKFNLENLLSTDILDIQLQPERIINDFIKNNYKSNYLQGLFRSENLSKEDFQLIPRDSIYYYLEGFSESEEEWGADKQLFRNLLKRFRQQTNKTLYGCYLINREWFNKESPKVRIREFTLYDFYFVIIWVDKNDPTSLYICEWSSD